jgi:hypothetical protein
MKIARNGSRGKILFDKKIKLFHQTKEFRNQQQRSDENKKKKD